ncbi:hypothetical protein [Oligoflexus tunisiensis]|uniref:hypothetical protein n=1 Tax=Oligoflexus tunisiensis TaxID=708132 RepID=UPI00114C8AAF|nr:hypothetical protein [Oligoflexus tunisiensis]
MTAFEQIERESHEYTNVTSDELYEMSIDDLQTRMSRALVQLEEAEDNRKAFSNAFGSLIKKIKADIRTMNREIRDRPGRDAEQTMTVENIQARLASGLAG